jgi:hypothetical protein
VIAIVAEIIALPVLVAVVLAEAPALRSVLARRGAVD